LAATSRSIPDFSNEQLPLAVDDVPGIGTTQLCRPELVDDTARIRLRGDICYPPSVTSRECPHGYTFEWSCKMPWCGNGPSAAAAVNTAARLRGICPASVASMCSHRDLLLATGCAIVSIEILLQRLW
jgi:hypothetical protein